MSEVPQCISNLSGDELRQKLIIAGIQPVPLTPTTTKLYQRKLAKKLGLLEEYPFEPSSNGKDEKCNQEDDPDVVATTFKSDVKQSGSPIVQCQTSVFYYAVFHSEGSQIFENYEMMMKFLKANKNARFQIFKSFSEAENWVSAEYEKRSFTDPQVSTTVVLDEKTNNFASLKQTDLNRLSKIIEADDVIEFEQLVWSDPRYLINISDGPVLLKPKARYNALHVAAKANRPLIIRKLFSVLVDTEYKQLMYPNEKKSDDAIYEIWMHHLLDLYCNTPDKGQYETPLHIASKLGHVDAVAELLSQTCCSKVMRNKEGRTAFDIICEKDRSNCPLKKRQIQSLLEDQFYVPLLRYPDNSLPPMVGEPWTPSSHRHHTAAATNSMITDGRLVRKNPLVPVPVVGALAGPMSSADAADIRRSWMSPGRDGGPTGKQMCNVRRSDMERGDERVGRRLAHLARVPWLEYWHFVDAYTDFTTAEGLDVLERFLRRREKQLDSTGSSGDSGGERLSAAAGDVSTAESGTEDAGGEKRHRANLSAGDASDFADKSATKSRLRLLSETLAENRRRALERCGYDCGDVADDWSRAGGKRITTALDSSGDDFMAELSCKFQSILHFGDDDERGDGDGVFSSPDDARPQPPTADACPDVSKITSDCNQDKASICINASTPCSKRGALFLTGTSPCKIDRDVRTAIGDTIVEKQQYPRICEWMGAISRYSEDEQRRWRTPKRKTRASKTWRESPIASSSTVFHWPASPRLKPSTNIH